MGISCFLLLSHGLERTEKGEHQDFSGLSGPGDEKAHSSP